MKKLKTLMIILLISTSVTMAQQLSTITFSEANSNLPTIGSTLNDPISISGFPATVRYIEVVINYDPTVITYVGVINKQDPAATANVTFPTSSQIKINYNKGGFTYFAVADGKLFDIQFSYSGGDSPLTFDPTCKYRTSSIIPITSFVHGAVDGNFISNTISNGPWATAGGWSLGVVPNAYHNVTVASGGTVTIAASTTGLCNNLTIQSGGQLTVDGTLTNSGNVLIESNASGTGSLLHNSALTATIERYIPGGGYHFVSIPTTQASNPVSGLFTGSYLYRFDAPTQAWLGYGSATDTPLTVDQGYMIWYVGGNTTYEFTGALNNGSFTAATPSLTVDQFCLIPNPYPSAIDWDAATGWNDPDMNSSMWVFSNGNYVTWNYVTETGTGSRYIAAGQSFFVQADVALATLEMNNGVRVHSNQQFLKNTKSDKPNLLNIKVQANDYEDAALVYFNENGSLVYNNQYDTYKLDGISDAPQLYTVKADDVHVTVNTLPFNINETTIVPLNFSLNANQEVTLDFTGMDSFEVSYGIELEDLLTGQIVNLREQSTYTFAHNVNDDASRFVLRFYGVTGIDSNSALNCKVWNSNELIYISIPALTGENAQIELYDLLGRKLSEVNCTINNPIQLTAPRSGIVMVKVIAGNKVQTSKLLIP
jgi:hypothetical protein